ncbi:TonB-dependent receptor, partial [Pseudonocardia sp. TMWB2A]|uniref:TonB-dependent receptor domain-containing protein n=1 Tax=Pseudonocardia sp. TMWB2A TaxID=687430 RepID=UPI00307D44E9
PRVDQLNAGVGFGVDRATGKPGGGGGNPMLDPWKADAFDISYEKYWGDKAYVSLAYFYKDLKTYIYTQTVDGYDWTDFVKNWKRNPGDAPVLNTGTYTAPMNGEGGKLQGFEVTASLPFGMLTPALHGFGIQASASFNDSNIKIVEPTATGSLGSAPAPLPGLSDRVYNLTAYYENNGFEARLSNRRRSDFVGEIGNFAGQRQLRMVKGENILDAQVGYVFPDASRMKGLALQLQVSNLTNGKYQTYTGTVDRPLEFIEWGRTYSLGATYKF